MTEQRQTQAEGMRQVRRQERQDAQVREDAESNQLPKGGPMGADVTLTEKLPVRLYTRAELEEAAMLAAGAASGVFLLDGSVMPSTEVAEAAQAIIDGYDQDHPSAEDLCESAWGIIANAHGGNWDEASDEWREAAERWRDGWHDLLDRTLKPHRDG